MTASQLSAILFLIGSVSLLLGTLINIIEAFK